MSRGTICPGSLAAKARSPGPPTAVYSVMNSVPPATALPNAPRKPPCCPPTEVPVCIWIAIDIHDSSPDSAKTFSLGCMFSSRTGITVPTIFDSMKRSLVAVVRVDHPAPRGMRHRVARAIVADTDHEHLGADGLEPVPFLEVVRALMHELLLDVHHASADLAHRVMVVAARELVMRRAVTEMRRVDRARRGQRVEGSIDGAAWRSRPVLVQLERDLFGGAVATQVHDGVVDHLPLRCAPHAWREHQLWLMTRSDRSAFVSTRHPPSSTTTSSSIRTPPKPGMYTPGSMVNTMPGSSTVWEPGSRLGAS